MTDATDPSGPDRPEDAQRHRGSWVRATVEWITVLALALGVALFVRSYVVQTYFIPSGSMEPTLQIGDHILVLKAAYRFSSPATGDVIVFTAPALEHQKCEDPAVEDLVKRIVGLPGQTIWSVGNTIWLEDPGSTHPYVLHQDWQHSTQLGQAIERQVIPANNYFVMGDNHTDSCDSRDWGTVPRANIIGKAVFIFWPPSQVGPI